MAGIGFELRKILRHDTYFNVLQAYSYAGIISAGPWIISIIGILLLGLLKYADPSISTQVVKFQVSITYLISLSLILSGFAQHSFTRYVSDQIFIDRPDRVIPNFNGFMLIMTLSTGILSILLVLFLFPQQPILYRLLMSASFVLLSNIWLATNLLSGLKSYRAILASFALGYAAVIGLSYNLRGLGLPGFMLGFTIGHLILWLGLLITIYRGYSSNRLLEFNFLQSGKLFYMLIFTSVFYNLGIWIDKYIFWYSPTTSMQILGPLRSSVIYDLPIFIAYLLIVPGMAVFLLRMETDFVDYYHQFYNAIRDRGTLRQIHTARNNMIISARQGILDIIKIQAFTILIVFIIGPVILTTLGLAVLYQHLLYVDVVGASLQVVFLGILNVLFYLDKRHQTLVLTALFVLFNVIFTLASIDLGPFYFGYGFTLSLVLVCATGMVLLDRDFKHLEYETFMLR